MDCNVEGLTHAAEDFVKGVGHGLLRCMAQIGFEVLVAPARKGDYHHIGAAEGQVVESSQRVGTLKRRKDAITAVQLVGGCQGLDIADCQRTGPS